MVERLCVEFEYVGGPSCDDVCCSGRLTSLAEEFECSFESRFPEICFYFSDKEGDAEGFNRNVNSFLGRVGELFCLRYVGIS